MVDGDCKASDVCVRISIPSQRLHLMHGSRVRLDVPVSTAANGAGERMDSYCTPRGTHVVRAKIGAGAPRGAVFVGRRATGEVFSPSLAEAHPNRDWILTRILWLSGTQRGFNRLGDVDTMRRFIYIHGTPDSVPLGQPGSAGCIRMNNDDVIALFDAIEPGTAVQIDD